MRLLFGCGVSALALTIVNTAFAGPDWVEDGDAGSFLQTAQVIDNVVGGQVRRIVGTLAGAPASAGGFGDPMGDFEDMYKIVITDPGTFFISTSPQYGGYADFQTSLWLFDSKGFGLLGNVYSPQDLFGGGEGGSAGELLGSTLTNYATDDTGLVIKTPGIYYLAITGVNRHPLASGPTEGMDIFSFAQFDEISGPDGPGANFPFIRTWWGDGQSGSYEIYVEGVGELPAPGALGLLLIGMARGRGRRRSK